MGVFDDLSFSLIGSVIAMLNFAKTERDKPVVTGIYRLSRHPIQIMAVVMWIGIVFFLIRYKKLLAYPIQAGLFLTLSGLFSIDIFRNRIKF